MAGIAVDPAEICFSDESSPSLSPRESDGGCARLEQPSAAAAAAAAASDEEGRLCLVRRESRHEIESSLGGQQSLSSDESSSSGDSLGRSGSGTGGEGGAQLSANNSPNSSNNSRSDDEGARRSEFRQGLARTGKRNQSEAFIDTELGSNPPKSLFQHSFTAVGADSDARGVVRYYSTSSTAAHRRVDYKRGNLYYGVRVKYPDGSEQDFIYGMFVQVRYR